MFSLDYGMMLDKKQIQVIFLFCCKQQRQLAALSMHLAQELLTNVQASGGSRIFAKKTSFKDEKCSGQL